MRQERTVSREREITCSTKFVQSRQDTGRTGDGTSSGNDAEGERIWRDTEPEEDNNKSIIMRAALLEGKETQSIIGSKFNNSRTGGGGGFEFFWKEKVCIERE